MLCLAFFFQTKEWKKPNSQLGLLVRLDSWISFSEVGATKWSDKLFTFKELLTIQNKLVNLLNANKTELTVEKSILIRKKTKNLVNQSVSDHHYSLILNY